MCDDLIKSREVIVKPLNQVVRRKLFRDGGKIDEVCEDDGDVLKILGLDRTFGLEFLSDLGRQDIEQELFRDLPLLLYFLIALFQLSIGLGQLHLGHQEVI